MKGLERVPVRFLHVLLVIAVLVSLGGVGVAAARPTQPTSADPASTRVPYEWGQWMVPVQWGWNPLNLAELENPPVVEDGYRWVVEMISVVGAVQFADGQNPYIVVGFGAKSAPSLYLPVTITQSVSTGRTWSTTLVGTSFYVDNPIGPEMDIQAQLLVGLHGGDTAQTGTVDVTLFGYVVPLATS